MTVLYRKNTNGTIQQWQQEIEGNKYRTITGQVGGKLTVSEWHVCSSKNVGKSNATSPTEQCQKEVAANYKKKRTAGGYVETIEELDNTYYFKPMLAKHYKNYAKNLQYPVFVQPKYDGIRCIINRQGAWSRTGESIITVPHILKSLDSVFNKYPQLVLDGELYNHKYKNDFNTICSVVKKLKPTAQDISTAENIVRFYMYDCFLPLIYSKRLEFLKCFVDYTYIVIVSTTVAFNSTEIDNLLNTYLEQGYEGAIIRTDSKYENKKSNNLLKYKVDNTDEFLLVDILEGQGNWAGLAKKALLITEDGIEFEASIANTQELCAYFLNNKHLYIGNPTTVKYSGLHPSGKPRFGVIKEFNRTY